MPDVNGNKRVRQKFKRHPIAYFHIDIAKSGQKKAGDLNEMARAL